MKDKNTLQYIKIKTNSIFRQYLPFVRIMQSATFNPMRFMLYSTIVTVKDSEMEGCFLKIDPTVKKETIYVCVVTLILSMLMESVFLIIRHWQLTVLFGNLVGAGVGILNFFLLGLSVQKAVKSEEKRAKDILRASHALRYALMAILVVTAVLIPSVFDMWATLISLLFANVAVYTRAIFNKDRKNGSISAETAADQPDIEGGEE